MAYVVKGGFSVHALFSKRRWQFFGPIFPSKSNSISFPQGNHKDDSKAHAEPSNALRIMHNHMGMCVLLHYYETGNLDQTYLANQAE